jgi:hypothetical protein
MPVELPIFHLGTYRSQNGTPVTFTPELLAQLARNTNFVIAQKALQPPVGYDHPAARDTDAHGHIASVRVDGGKLIATLDGTSAKLRDDAKNFRRLTYSPEFNTDFEFVHEGKPVKIGPTVIGLAMLGAQRGAIKNTAMVPLSEVPFGEGVDAVSSMMLRSELRSLGYIGEYEVEGKFFAEVENDSRRFSERQEQTMTDAEIQAAIAAGVKANIDAAIAPAVAAAVKPLQDQIKSFSETSKREADVHSFCETIASTKKSLNKLSLDRLRTKILLHPDMTPALDAEVRAFVEGLSAVVLPGGVIGKKKNAGADDPEDEGDADPDEPKDLAAVRPKHFANIEDPQAQQVVNAAMTAFAEFKPEAVKGIEGNPSAIMNKVRAYVIARDTAATN